MLTEFGNCHVRLASMSRAQRLLDLIQVLRRHRHPVSGAVLAEATGVSLRTVYRDIDTLKAEGAHIDGEAGVGYVLRPGFMLPPLMFSEEEIEAIVLGSRWVHQRADKSLAGAAANVLAKIGAVLPDDLRETLDDSGLLVGPGETVSAGDAELPKIRQAIRRERKLAIAYADKAGAAKSVANLMTSELAAALNRSEALERLAERIRLALRVPAVRHATRPTRASQRRRVEEKISRGRTKALRRSPAE